MKDVVTAILGGGQGTRLWPLTRYRAKPAVPVGGKFRLIDIPISNSLHAGIEQVFVLTQFNSASLHRHIAQTYRFDVFSEGFVNILAAEQGLENRDWYQGTADAVRH
jgi:glucose-1-phosphate adenylyltransferase